MEGKKPPLFGRFGSAMTPAPMVTYAVVYVPAQMAAQMTQVPAISMAQQDASCPSPSATPSESKDSDAIAELEDETPVLRKTNSLPNLETSGLSPMSDKVKSPPSTTSTASGDEAMPGRQIEAIFPSAPTSDEEDLEGQLSTKQALSWAPIWEVNPRACTTHAA